MSTACLLGRRQRRRARRRVRIPAGLFGDERWGAIVILLARSSVRGARPSPAPQWYLTHSAQPPCRRRSARDPARAGGPESGQCPMRRETAAAAAVRLFGARGCADAAVCRTLLCAAFQKLCEDKFWARRVLVVRRRHASKGRERAMRAWDAWDPVTKCD